MDVELIVEPWMSKGDALRWIAAALDALESAPCKAAERRLFVTAQALEYNRRTRLMQATYHERALFSAPTARDRDLCIKVDCFCAAILRAVRP